MCGRYNISDSPHVRALMIALGMEPIGLPRRFNIAPTEQVPAIHWVEGNAALSEMRWWLTPHWSDGPSQKYAMFNARSETAEKSSAFKGPFKYRRAVIPATSFVEWQKTASGKQPYLIEPAEGTLAFGGLWDYWSDGIQEVLSCAILTTQATDSFSHIHNRMPVLLEAEQLDAWLDEKTDLADIYSMLAPYEGGLISTPISTSINSGKAKLEPQAIGDPTPI